MKLHFTVDKQQLKRDDDEILASYSKNFVRCVFECRKQWDDVYKKALFCDVSNKKYIVDLGFGKKVSCRIPCDVLKGNYFHVSIFGIDLTHKYRITTNQENILIEPSGFSDAVDEALSNSQMISDSDMLTISSDAVSDDKPRLVSCFYGYNILKNPQHDEHLY